MVVTVRTLDRQDQAPGRRRRSTHCEATDCHKATREGKPFCSDHVALHPYVAQLLQDIEQREATLARIARRGRVTRADLESELGREVLREFLHGKSKTVPGVARQAKLDQRVVLAFAKAFGRRKGLVCGQTRRGEFFLAVEQQRPAA